MNKQSASGAERAHALLSWLSPHQEEMAALLTELVAIPTENPPGRNYRACTNLLEKRLRDHGLDCERFEVAEGGKSSDDAPVCLLASYGRDRRALYFHGHYDVVPAQSPEQFQPLRKEHFLFGRGSADMKGGIVAMLFAILALKECGPGLNGRIGLLLVPNEETGGECGSARLAQQGLLGRDGIGMLLAEPTGGVVWNASRGAMSVRVQVLGKSAHVGLQHQGENAFERMHEVVERLQKLKREVEKRTTRWNAPTEQMRHSIMMLGGQCGGGANFNVVPERCWFTIDRRINPEEDLLQEKARLLAVLEACQRDGIPLEWEILQEGRSAACSQDEPLGRTLAHSVRAVSREEPRFELCPGLLETRFYCAEGIPAYAYGPGLLSVAHGPNEYIDIRKMIECAAIYALTAIDMFPG